mmetsp:Transcript_87017/g.211166  ORF Transcript_87017/g.211166 Transcript_87017/m.211166 type:complete len:203 (+) Transcript_87017:304-912(+)
MAPTSTSRRRSRARPHSNTQPDPRSGSSCRRRGVGGSATPNAKTTGSQRAGCAAALCSQALCLRAWTFGRRPSLASGSLRSLRASGCLRVWTWHGSKSGSQLLRLLSLRSEVCPTALWTASTTSFPGTASQAQRLLTSTSSVQTSGSSWHATSGGGSETPLRKRQWMTVDSCTAPLSNQALILRRPVVGTFATRRSGRSAGD